jgi:hypothetical protein
MRTTIIGGLTVITLAAVAGVATAQQPAPARAVRSAEPVAREAFVAHRVDRLASADANGDGSVSAEELRAARQARRADKAASAFDRLDTDRDGMISRAEFDARASARAERGPRAHRGDRARPARAERAERGPVDIAEARAKAEQAFDRLDADRDGVLSPAERQAGREAMREHRRERMGERRAARAAEQSPQAPASE